MAMFLHSRSRGQACVSLNSSCLQHDDSGGGVAKGLLVVLPVVLLASTSSTIKQVASSTLGWSSQSVTLDCFKLVETDFLLSSCVPVVVLYLRLLVWDNLSGKIFLGIFSFLAFAVNNWLIHSVCPFALLNITMSGGSMSKRTLNPRIFEICYRCAGLSKIKIQYAFSYCASRVVLLRYFLRYPQSSLYRPLKTSFIDNDIKTKHTLQI